MGSGMPSGLACGDGMYGFENTLRTMKRNINALLCAVLASLCWTGCFPEDRPFDPPVVTPPEQKPGEKPGQGEEQGDKLTYDNLNAYDYLKNYVDRTVSPDFKLGAAVTATDFIRKGIDYELASANFDEMTPGNAMKGSSVVRRDGSMDFSTVRSFLDAAQKAGMTVYGHTLAWHSQQPVEYLNGLLQGKKTDLPPGETGEELILSVDFNDGTHPFNGWGNNSSRTIENGAFKVTNPSAVQYWEAQFAYDVQSPFVKGQAYKLKFKVKGSAAGSFSAGFQIVDGYKSAGEFPSIDFDTQWKDIEVECTCNASGATRLIFSFGAFVGDIYIDDFSFSATGLDYNYTPLTPAEKKEVLTEAMDRWIKGMMEVTATRVSVWDAVNESVSGRDNDGDGYYELESAAWGDAKNFYWQDYLGSEDYVRIVIAKARKYYAEYGGTAPLKLFINDYNLESDWDDNKKLKSLIHWIGIWESDGVTKIDGIGTQMHISYYENPSTQASKEKHVVKMLELMAATGKLVKISELDMGYVDKNGNTLPATSVSDSQHRAMAGFYEFIVRKYLEIVPPAQQYGITQWCMQDAPGSLGTGWRGGEPVGLWDRNCKRKYAYAGFADGLRKK